MRQITTVLILVVSASFCNAQSDFVILQDQKIVNELIVTFKILPESAITTNLSATEFDLVKTLFSQCVTHYNNQIKESFMKRGEKRKYARMYEIMRLENYKIQYVPFLNEKGEKEVWINGFCSSFDSDWRKDIIHVFDGGNCYFTIRLNLSTGKCISAGTNGYG